MTVHLRLFVAGGSARAVHAEQSLARFCDLVWPDNYELDVVDVLARPDLADEARVLATPMVHKTSPAPEQRIVGDFADQRRLATALNVVLPTTASGDPR